MRLVPARQSQEGPGAASLRGGLPTEDRAPSTAHNLPRRGIVGGLITDNAGLALHSAPGCGQQATPAPTSRFRTSTAHRDVDTVRARHRHSRELAQRTGRWSTLRAISNSSLSGAAVAWRPVLAHYLLEQAAAGRLGFSEIVRRESPTRGVGRREVTGLQHVTVQGIGAARRPHECQMFVDQRARQFGRQYRQTIQPIGVGSIGAAEAECDAVRH